MSVRHLRSVEQEPDAAEFHALRRERDQLRTALATRIVIEQAKGMLAERFQMDVDEAFERLRGEARSRRMKLHALAAALTAREAWTDPIFRPAEPRNAPAGRSAARDASRTLAPRTQTLRLQNGRPAQ